MTDEAPTETGFYWVEVFEENTWDNGIMVICWIQSERRALIPGELSRLEWDVNCCRRTLAPIPEPKVVRDGE
jgi:hypothetical protein